MDTQKSTTMLRALSEVNALKWSSDSSITMMRVLGDVPVLALFKPPRRNAVRVRVLRGSEWVDITNRVKRGTITESNDQAITTLDLELLNGVGFPSLAPRREDSEINRVNGQYEPLLWPGRQIKVWAASSTDGTTPHEWVPVFHGVLGDEVDSVSKPNTVRVFARDLAKWLLDDHIVGPVTYRNMYGSQIIQQLLIDRYNAKGLPVQIPFRAIGDDDHWVEEYTIENLTTWQAIQNIVDQSGRDCRFKLDESDGEFKLTYWLPSLDMSQPDWIIIGSDIRTETLRISDAQLRNRVEVAFRDSQGVKHEVVATNNQVPVRLCRIEEADTELIRDIPSAQRFADRVLAYLQDLHATDELTVPFNPYISLFDIIEVQNPKLRSEPERYAVDSRTLTFSADQWDLSLVASGSVGVTPQRWIDKETRPGVKKPWVPDDSTTNRPMPTPTGVQAVGVPGGISITFDEPDPKRWAETLVYVSTTTPVDMEAPPAVKGKVIPLEVPGEPGVPLYARIVHVDAYGNRSEPSAEVTATPDRVVETPDDTPPATPTGLTADFTGPDLYLSWAPVDRAVRYRVRISDANGVRRERHVSGSSYVYTYTENQSDGSPARSSLTVEVWAQTQEGVYSTTPATITAINAPPTQPTAVAESSLTQIRWRITSDLPPDFRQVKVTVGTYTVSVPAASGVINLRDAGIDDGAQANLSFVIIDVFGQESTPYQTNVQGHYVSESDLAGEIFEVVYHSEQFPAGADPAVLYDNDPTTGIVFTQAPTITIKHPQEERFGMLHLHVDQDVDGYVQIRRANAEDWEDVIGSPSNPYEFKAGENTVAFSQMRIKLAQEVRVVLLSPVGVYECVPQVYLVANHILSGTVQLTQHLHLENEDGSLRIEPYGIEMHGEEGSTHWTPGGLYFKSPLGVTTGYVRGIASGVAEDGERVELQFINTPHVFLQPYDMMVFEPAHSGEKQRILLQAADISPDGFTVIAKTMLEAGRDLTHVFQRRRYQVPYFQYCSGTSSHTSTGTFFSSESAVSVGDKINHVTTNSDVTRVEIRIQEMLHAHAYAGNYVATNRITYEVRLRPVGSQTWLRTTGPIEKSITAASSLLTTATRGTHHINTIVWGSLPSDQYEIEIEVLSKVIHSSNGYNSDLSCWVLLDQWTEFSGSEIVAVNPARVQWLAIETDNVVGEEEDE